MHFYLENNDKYRLGRIQCKEYSLKTPTCFLYTKLGSVPYLSIDVLRRTKLLPSIVHMPINQFMEHMGAVKLFPQGLQEFTSLQDTPLYCSVHDAGAIVPSGYNNSSGVALWNKSGKTMLDASKYMDVIEHCLPNCFECVYDGEHGGKKTCRGVDRSLQLLDACLSRLHESQRLQACRMYGVVVGGFEEKERIRSAKETSLRQVDGFSIAGFHNFGPPACNLDLSAIEALVATVLPILPADKPRLMHGPMSPTNLLHLASLGIDLFDSSYAHLVSDCEGALNLDILDFIKAVKLKEGDGGHIGRDLVSAGPSAFAAADNDNDTSGHNDDGDTKYNIIFLKEKRYHDDERPLLIGCDCLTCTQHCRAYIHHLLSTHELLASILLTIHNTQHYNDLMEAVRESMKEDKVHELKTRLEARITPDIAELLLKKEKKLPSYRRNNDSAGDGGEGVNNEKKNKKKSEVKKKV